jgi:TetR/AcrR family transcriptional regulator, transcriptional repressor for nem operon
MPRRKAFDPELALDRATELFCAHGYDGTSVTKLLAAMQLSRQSLYDTFGDKHSLYVACLRQHRARLRVRFAQVFAEQHSATVRLRTLFALDFDATGASSGQASVRGACLMANAALELGQRDLAVREQVAAHLREVENTFFRVVIEGQSSGELEREQDARALARFLTNAIHGLGVLARGGAPSSTLHDALTTTLAVVQHSPERHPPAFLARTQSVAQA